MPGPEARIVAAIRRALEARGAVTHKTHGGPHAHRGEPDLLICLASRFVALEVKAPGVGRRATPLQVARLRAWARAGAVAAVVRSPAEALTLCYRHGVLATPDGHVRLVSENPEDYTEEKNSRKLKFPLEGDGEEG